MSYLTLLPLEIQKEIYKYVFEDTKRELMYTTSWIYQELANTGVWNNDKTYDHANSPWWNWRITKPTGPFWRMSAGKLPWLYRQ
jgi:hypothetical protein